MQGSVVRCLILAALFAGSAFILGAIDGPRTASAARWPAQDAFFGVTGWMNRQQVVESRSGIPLVSREYFDERGFPSPLLIMTTPDAKRISRAGADVPFLGSGHVVDQAPPSLVPPARDRGALIAQREDQTWLVLY